MKVLLARPKSTTSPYEIPLGIAYIASYIRECGHEVKIIDGVVGYDNESIGKEIENYKPDIVGISFLSYDRKYAYELAKIAKSKGSIIIFGGHHATFKAEEILKRFNFVDYIVRGEGEDVFLNLLNKLESKKPLNSVKGLTYRKNGKIISNPNQDFIKDIDKLPAPALDLLEMDKYPYHAIMGSRGCPYDCIFCASPAFWKRCLRVRDPVNVANEIEDTIKKYGNKIVHLKDDTFTARKDWVKRICVEIKKRNLNITWECLARVNTVDEDILKMIKEAGCTLVEYGIESGNDAILKKINKHITKSQVEKAFELTKKVDLKSGAFFMIGNLGDTEETIKESFEFAIKLRPDTIVFNIANILPGTQLEKIAIVEGILDKNFDWDAPENLDKVPYYLPNNLNKEKMLEIRKKYYIRFALERLYNPLDKKDKKYVFDNDEIFHHFRPFSKKDLRILIEEVKRIRKLYKSTKGDFLLFKLFSKLSAKTIKLILKKIF